MAAYSNETLGVGTGWGKECSGNPRAIEWVVVTKAGIEQIDMSNLSTIQAAIANGNIQTIIPVIGARNASSPVFRSGTGNIPKVRDGSTDSAGFNADDVKNNASLADLLNNHCGRFGVILVYGDLKTEHILTNGTTQVYKPVSYDFNHSQAREKTATGRYDCVVEWVNATMGYWGNAANENALNTPLPPVQTSATSLTSSGGTINWGAVSGATAYTVDVDNDPAFGTPVSGFDDLNVGNVLTKAVTGLSASTVYYARVRALNLSGESGNSNTIIFTTTA